MNFKSFVATALLAATTVVGTAAQAQPGARAIFNALDRAGVTYSSHECASYDITGTYGFYVPKQNHIHICTDVATTEAQQWETLRHEAVHAAQRCVDPSMQSTVLKWSFLANHETAQSDWDFIVRAYDKEDHRIELEAFTLMRYDNASIASLVNTACN